MRFIANLDHWTVLFIRQLSLFASVIIIITVACECFYRCKHGRLLRDSGCEKRGIGARYQESVSFLRCRTWWNTYHFISLFCFAFLFSNDIGSHTLTLSLVSMSFPSIGKFDILLLNTIPRTMIPLVINERGP